MMKSEHNDQGSDVASSRLCSTQGRKMTSSLLTMAFLVGIGTSLLSGAEAAAADDDKHPIVVLDTTAGEVVLQLDAEKAPITVANFMKYVDDKFYDDLIFHRVIGGFMIQGGGFDANVAEKRRGVRAPIPNESGNGLSNERGTIAMARTSDPNSATCQFFINHGDNARLDNAGGGYAVFGKVISGLDVVDKIAQSRTTFKAGMGDVPVETIAIKSAKRKAK
jgi:peptidyl-prolyl cis-trans isomerase A (cyclophilin A)